MPQRAFLFLQGVCSPFFTRLADRLAADKHRICRINFNVGDSVYWRPRPAWNFRGELDDLPAYMEEKIESFGITDLVLFGDRRAVHLPAIRIAEARAMRLHVFEEGYFRPYWITLERGGVNGHSRLPRDPDWYRAVGASLPEYGDGRPFASSLRARALHDAAYHLAGVANPLLFPGYRTHWPYSSAKEYAGYARRFPLLPWHTREARTIIERLSREGARYYVLPLQLNSDAQILHDSPFAGMGEVIERVMRSFAAHAPANTRLVVKNHPLDTGLQNYRRLIRSLGQRLGVSGRVDYLEAGDTSALVARARGVVTVNSTVGASALMLNCATVALGAPLYDLPGLTFQGPLDAFWREGSPPDADLFRKFRNTVIHATQVNGGFYTADGIALAVANSQRALEAERSPLESLL